MRTQRPGAPGGPIVPLFSRLLAATTVIAVVFGGARVAPQEVSNPDLFTKSLEAAAQALHHYGPYDNPEEWRRVNDIGYRLAAQAGYDKSPFSFYVVDMPIPNAFALPAGHIFVTRGMLDLGLSDDMLAALLGHEIAHVTQEHFLKMRKRATLLNVLSQVLTVGVMIGASQRDSPDTVYGRYPDNRQASLVEGAAATGLVVTELLLRSYSRENEDESDEEGQRYAAAAGYDPDGARQLMAKMQLRIPQSKSYGYWQTHPFFEERVRAAGAREEFLTVREGKPADGYRQNTQAVLLDFVEGRELSPPMILVVKESALAAWPQGPAADSLRLEKLHALQDQELQRPPMARDYGKLMEAYGEELATVEELTPDSPLLATLRQEMGDLRSQLKELYPKAVEIFAGGVFETPFLETFLSNYPEAPEAPEVALELGVAYSRLGRETDAVAQLLTAWQGAVGTEAGEKARMGLRNLAPVLDQLGALQHLASQDDDLELQKLSAHRLEQMASSYDDLADGADYLRRFSDGRYVAVVNERLNALAENLYREMLLYQKLGDTGKALDRINQILTFAPLSPAAGRLSDHAILEG